MSQNKLTQDIEQLYNSTQQKDNYNGFYQRIFKRGIDILISIIILPFLLIIAIPIAIAIKIEDGGPIFYKSRRLGKNFKEFNMLKFRSMKIDSPDLRNEDGSTFNSRTDPRVTRVGRFIRETSLDELPQFLNVLVGDMRFVGPRAGDIESKDTYETDEKDKMLVHPGITGYTQAYYRNNLSVREKRLYDAWYSHNVSISLDFKIIIKTISTVFKRENLYTNEENASSNKHEAKK